MTLTLTLTVIGVYLWPALGRRVKTLGVIGWGLLMGYEILRQVYKMGVIGR